MAASLLEGVNRLVTPDLLAKAARYLDASEGSVAAALGAAFPSILAGLAEKGDTPRTMRPFFDLITSPENDGRVLRNPALAVGAASGDPPLASLGRNFLSSLFGPRLYLVGELVRRSAGLQPGAVVPLLRIAAPLVLGYLGKRVISSRLGPDTLSDLLLRERDGIMRAVPIGLSPVLGPTDSATAPLVSQEEASRPRLLQPALATLVVLATMWMLPRIGRPAVPEQTRGFVSRSAALVAEPAASESDLPPDVLGATWEWIGFAAPVDPSQVDAPGRYTIRFGFDGRVAVTADCNLGNAGYSIHADGRLALGPMVLTRAACAPGSQSDRFVREVNRATGYFVDGDDLLLPVDSGMLRFRRQN